MADKPATTKDNAALEKKIGELQKQVDEQRKWFLDEKKEVHSEIDQIIKAIGAKRVEVR